METALVAGVVASAFTFAGCICADIAFCEGKPLTKKSYIFAGAAFLVTTGVVYLIG